MKRLTTMLALAALTFVGAFLAAPSVGDVNAITCTSPKYVLYESYSAASDSTGPYCANIADLSAIPHVPPGNCESVLWGQETWDDCVSAIEVSNLAAGRCISLYSGAYYSNLILKVKGPVVGTARFYVSSFWNDSASSVKYNYSTAQGC